MSVAPIAIPSIATERLLLRSWRPDDLDPLLAMLSDADHAHFVGSTTSRGDAWRRMAAFVGHWSLRGFGVWAVSEAGDGPWVGWCGLWFPEEWPEPEIGWALAPAMTGKGYATEAALAARRYAYDVLGWSTAISFIDPLNKPSQRVAERMGARLEGTAQLRGVDVGLYRHLPRATLSSPTRH